MFENLAHFSDIYSLLLPLHKSYDEALHWYPFGTISFQDRNNGNMSVSNRQDKVECTFWSQLKLTFTTNYRNRAAIYCPLRGYNFLIKCSAMSLCYFYSSSLYSWESRVSQVFLLMVHGCIYVLTFCKKTIGFFTISISDRKSDRISARQKNSGKINLLKSCLKWDLISQQQPSLLWSLTPNHLGHRVLCWMGDLSNELQSHSIDSRNYPSPKS